jgi:hypothetical protein
MSKRIRHPALVAPDRDMLHAHIAMVQHDIHADLGCVPADGIAHALQELANVEITVHDRRLGWCFGNNRV